MKDDRAFSVVVLPEPVPPETMMFSRPDRGLQIVPAISSVKAPNVTRSSILSVVVLNFRMDTSEPSTASGGIIALKRMPSGRRASHHRGWIHPPGGPRATTILSMIRSRWRSSRKVTSVSSSLPARSTKTAVGVDQDVGDGRVVQQRLDRPQPQHLVLDFPHQTRALGFVQRDRVARRSSARPPLRSRRGARGFEPSQRLRLTRSSSSWWSR